jgi:hypothetical protein
MESTRTKRFGLMGMHVPSAKSHPELLCSSLAGAAICALIAIKKNLTKRYANNAIKVSQSTYVFTLPEL